MTWVKVNERWSEQSRVLFTLLALVIASFMTLPFTNPRVPTGDAYVLTAVLHYSTAILGSWFIPYFSNADKSAGHE
mgnify:FL=1